MIRERGAELLVAHLVDQLRQGLEREHALDPEQLAQLREHEVAWVAQLRDACTRLSSRRAANRSATAMIASAGFAAPCVGKTLPSQTNRFGTPHTRFDAS